MLFRSSNLALVPVVFLFTACSGTLVKSVTGAEAEGFVYYLPKQLVKLEIARRPVPTQMTDKLAKARDQVLSAKAEMDTQGKLAAHLEASLKAARASGVSEAVISALNSKLGVAQSELNALKVTFSEANKGLVGVEDQIRLLTQLNLEQKQFEDKITVTLLPPVADTEKRYVAQMNGDSQRSVDFKLKSTSAGLLSLGDATSIDQTSEIIVAAIDSLGSVAAIPFAYSNKRIRNLDSSVPKLADCKPFNYVRIFDPASELDTINAELLKQTKECNNLRLDFSKIETSSGASGSGNGLYYRRKLPRVLTIISGDRVLSSELLEVPNGAPAERLELDLVALATTQHDVALIDGMLTEHHAVKPSSTLEVVKAPGKAAEALLAIPAKLLTVRIDQSKKQTELTTAELNLLKELAKLEAERNQTEE